MSFAYKRAKADHDGEPRTFTIDDQTFTLRSKMGSKAAERVARSIKGDDPAAMWEALEALFISHAEYERFIDLDLDPETELSDVLSGIYSLYADPGESSASSAPSPNIGLPSTPTSNGSTSSTLPDSGSVSTFPSLAS